MTLAYLLLLLFPLLWSQRSLHRELQIIFLLITRRADISLVLFSMLLFPGVLLHEGSHWVAAKLLRVRTGSFSLVPRPMPGGRLQLGYVETAASDPLRDALIGAAPMLLGGAFVAYVGLAQLQLLSLWNNIMSSGVEAALDGLAALNDQPDFWLWFYLTFAVSSTMMPSASDRRSWLPVLLVASLLVGITLLVGAGPWLVERLSAPLERGFRVVTAVLAISLIVQLVLLLPAWALHRVLVRLTRLDVSSR